MSEKRELYLLGKTVEDAAISSYVYQDKEDAMRRAGEAGKKIFEFSVWFDTEDATEVSLNDDAEKEARRVLTQAEYLATVVHSATCHSNHTDACGWLYEDWNTPGYAKQKALTSAEKVIATGIDVEDYMNALQVTMDRTVDWTAEKKYSWA